MVVIVGCCFVVFGSIYVLKASVADRRRSGRAIGEEVAKHQHLTDADRQDAERFDDRPPQDALVDVLGTFAAWKG